MMARKPSQDQSARVNDTSDISTMAAYAGMVIFIVLAYVSLIGYNSHYLKEVEVLSLFIPDIQYFKECMAIPGGLLFWAASFLTQFFFHPWLGTSVMVALLIGLWWLITWTFNLPKSLFTAAAIPSAMLLLAFLSPGYLIYVAKTQGFAYVGIIGVAVSTIICRIYMLRQPLAWKVCVLLAGAALYPLFGFYSLFGILLASLQEINNKQRNWIAIIIGMIGIISIPRITYYIPGIHLMQSQMYTSGLPRFGIDNTLAETPYVICFAIVCAFGLFGRWLASRGTRQRLQVGLSSSLFVVTVVSMMVGQFRDHHLSENGPGH